MITQQKVLDEVRFKLGQTNGMKMKLELNERDLATLVSASLRELTTFMDTPRFVTVPYQEIINIENLKIAGIINIMRAKPPAGVMQGVSLDPFYLSGVTSVTQPGSPDTHGILQTQIQYAIRAMAQNTVQEDLSYMTNLYDKEVYVSYSGIRPSSITIIYKPVIESVEDLPSDYWTTFLIRLAVAHGKIIIGRIRTKYSVPNAPYSVNGDILQEGLTELLAIREELKKTRGAVFG